MRDSLYQICRCYYYNIYIIIIIIIIITILRCPVWTDLNLLHRRCVRHRLPRPQQHRLRWPEKQKLAMNGRTKSYCYDLDKYNSSNL